MTGDTASVRGLTFGIAFWAIATRRRAA